MNELHKIAFDYRNAVLPDDAHEAWQELEQYVKQLINNEREACAKFIDDLVLEHPGRADLTAQQFAAAIRARGQQ